ncbi:hypothetical protein EGW08_001913 [Elysia chlorotica]|uniref:Uncharacterized protein n=1 Tax=Elysia chlorotica TaxID=188477 RepID=A0A433U8Z9_ELYCH|nr:hypothetical protein EGW08_001913 [Elysia chlorotica]
MYYFNNNRRTVLYFTYHFVMERFMATVLLSFAVSYILSLLIETPVRNIIKPSKKNNKPSGRTQLDSLGSKARQDQDKKSSAIPMASFSKLSRTKAEGMRSRNVYLPDEPRSATQTPSSPEPKFPMSVGSGLYPSILSETQESRMFDRQPTVKRESAYKHTAYETITKTASFDDEEATGAVNSDYISLLDQPMSPAVTEERPNFLRQKLEEQRQMQQQTDSPQPRDADYSKAWSKRKRLPKFAETSQEMRGASLGEMGISSGNIDRQTNPAEQPIRIKTDSAAPQTTQIIADVEEPREPPQSFQTAVRVSTKTDKENLPTDPPIAPEVIGIVNEGYDLDPDDVEAVLPSAPPETPKSGRSETSKNAEPMLA